MVKKQQLIIVAAGFILLILLYFFGNTTPSKSNNFSEPVNNSPHSVKAEDILVEAKKNLKPNEATYLTRLENSVVRGNIKEQQINVYKQLAAYWQDTLQRPDIAAFYTGEQAKLENSEKNLNFAARLLLDHALAETDPSEQKWLATNAKELFEKSLQKNPNNDSVKIGLGACYLFGNISASPMEGIIKIKEVADRDTANMYAQLMLGLGDIKSGQYDKAIERLQKVLNKEPYNLQAAFNLAETYERKGDKVNAIEWYRHVQHIVNIPEAKEEIEQRIQSLQ